MDQRRGVRRRLLDRGFAHVDPAVCAQLAGRAPGVPPVEIRPDSDLYVAGELVWDCPPYEPWE